MKFRVFQDVDGSVRIVHPNPRYRLDGESDDAFIERIGQKTVLGDPSLAGLPFVDVDEATLPNDHSKREKWRGQGEKIVVGNSIPDKPHPKQGLIDRANNANSVAELKQILVELIK